MLERCGCAESRAYREALEQVVESAESIEQYDPEGVMCRPLAAIARAALSSVESEAQYAARSGPQPEPPVLGEPVPLFAPKPHHDCDGSCAKHRAGVGLDS